MKHARRRPAGVTFPRAASAATSLLADLLARWAVTETTRLRRAVRAVRLAARLAAYLGVAIAALRPMLRI